MHKQASEYIAEIKGQRQRLRINMTEAAFCTWHAETLTILEYITEIAPLRQRFIDVGKSNNSVVDKVEEVRGILSSVVRRISSQLFGTGIVPASPFPNTGGVYFAQAITQALTQPINVNLDGLLQRVDEVQGISDANKEEARSVVKSVWDHITSGVKDSTKYIGFAAQLTALGFKWKEILDGLPF